MFLAGASRDILAAQAQFVPPPFNNDLHLLALAESSCLMRQKNEAMLQTLSKRQFLFDSETVDFEKLGKHLTNPEHPLYHSSIPICCSKKASSGSEQKCLCTLIEGWSVCFKRDKKIILLIRDFFADVHFEEKSTCSEHGRLLGTTGGIVF